MEVKKALGNILNYVKKLDIKINNDDVQLDITEQGINLNIPSNKVKQKKEARKTIEAEEIAEESNALQEHDF